MALSLGISVGSKIRVGTSVVEVVSVMGTARVLIKVEGKEFMITDCERTEILPNVFVSCGRNDDKQFLASFSRLAFEAPRSIEINRMMGGPGDQTQR